MQSIYLAGGCFWCTEAVFSLIKGVKKATPGYMGGELKNPTYNEVCSGKTGHAEVIKCDFNDKEIGLENLLTIFFSTHDPTQLNRQGNDVGTQYRSGIFFIEENQKTVSLKKIQEEEIKRGKKLATDVSKAEHFYIAEDYHLNYFNTNPSNPYCNIIISPKIRYLKSEFSEYLK